MANGFKLITVLRIPIYINYTWFIVFSLVVSTLAMNYFPQMGPYYSPLAQWGMAFVTAFILFTSILMHELAHSYVAQRQGITIKSITLFVFGGIAHMLGESRTPRGEMKIAAAGPALSLLLSGAFWGIIYFQDQGMPASPLMVIAYFLASTNMILAIFNLIPGFPLDGGRILRAIIWERTGNINKATLVTSRIGKGFALFLMIIGLWDLLQGAFIGGLWLIFIGVFLQQAADEGYRQTLLHRALSSVKVRDVMTTPVIVVNEDIALDRIVNDFFFRYRFNSFPVVLEDRLVGIVSLHDIKDVKKEEWPYKSVKDIMGTDLSDFTISPGSDAIEALNRMVESQRGRLVVTEDGKVVGIISQRNIMQMLKLKTDLSNT
ncbi:MAG: site-2 protease family protein [Nitrospirae bacterium]|nr:site-2 protease family protein [Nitrospirota bacterium]